MLAKTVAAMKADEAKTLDLINKGEGGFLDRDLYPFCANVSDGKSVALGNPNAKQLLGVDTRTLKLHQASRDTASTKPHIYSNCLDLYQDRKGKRTSLLVRSSANLSQIGRLLHSRS